MATATKADTNATTSQRREASSPATETGRPRRRLGFWRRMLIGLCFVAGVGFTVAAWLGDITPDDLTEVAGAVGQVEPKMYSDESLLYLRVAGASGRFKYSDSCPGFEAFSKAIAPGTPVRLWVERSALQQNMPATIYQAEVDGRPLIRFEETQPIHNQERWYVLIFGGFCLLAGFGIWKQAQPAAASGAAAAAPSSQADDEEMYRQIAERNWLLVAIVAIVVKVGKVCEQIPLFGEVAIAFFYFWILPLYMVYLYVVARARRWLVAAFCFSYWSLLLGLFVAAVTVPDFPWASEYPELGPLGSRLTAAYIHLNLVYGGLLLLWALLMEPKRDEAPSS